MPGTFFCAARIFLICARVRFSSNAIGHGHGFGMVGEGDVFVAQIARSFAHLLDGVLAVGGGGVHLQVAANVGKFYEVRKFVLFRRFDLAGHFAEFRLDVVEAELGVDFLLRSWRRRPCRP